MPIYDFSCPACNAMHSELLDFDAYDAFEEGTCECGATVTKADRIIGGGVKTRVIGVSKGNYNGNDYT